MSAPGGGGSRFFDADDPSGTAPVCVQLEWELLRGEEKFKLVRRIGYRDPAYGEPFIVPADLQVFRSDLASVPPVFTWLVPRTGNHLPAALVHDGMVCDPADRTYLGPEVSREEADRIFRDGMAHLGVGRLRRWLIWTAVALATALTSAAKGGMLPRWRWIAVVGGTLAVVAGLGVLATVDLFDGCTVLPWMADRSWWVEVLTGLAFAIAIPVVLAALWGRLWRAGVIACVALALLLHVTVVLAVLLAGYQFVESPRRALAAARRVLNVWIIVAALAFAGAIALVLWWRCP